MLGGSYKCGERLFGCLVLWYDSWYETDTIDNIEGTISIYEMEIMNFTVQIQSFFVDDSNLHFIVILNV